jgi:hypothetical protein
MKLENILLSEVILAQNTKNHMFSLTWGLDNKGKHNKRIGLDHIIRQEHTREVWGEVRHPKNKIAVDSLNAKKLMQKF